MDGKWRAPGVVLLLGLAVLVCFLPALGSQFVLWDDDMNFTDNPSYRGLSASHLRWMFTTLYGGHYQPLSWLTLGLDYTVWAMNPTGYHLTNLLLHAANAVLLFLLLNRLTAAFGVHPLGCRGRPRDHIDRRRHPKGWTPNATE